MTTRVKAKTVFVMLKEKARPSYDLPYDGVKFAASSGWLKQVKNHSLSHNGKASVDVKADKEFLETLSEIIVKENYLSEQLFNINGSSVFWKWMPERTFFHNEVKSMPGFKVSEDRAAVFLGGYVTGYKLKPFKMQCSENPRAFKCITWSVLYRGTKGSWVSQVLL